MTGITEDGMKLMGLCFGDDKIIKLTSRTTENEKNIENGQAFLSKGLITGFRNPTSHTPRHTQPWFSDMDCLDFLGLISYLTRKVENAEVIRSDEEQE